MPEAEGATEDNSAKKPRSAGETDPALLSSTRQLRAFGDSLDRQLERHLRKSSRTVVLKSTT